MSDDDRGERARVYTRIAPVILAFHDLQADKEFHVEQLRQYVREQVPGIAPDSPGRILRALRQEGRLDYVNTNRRRSLYQFCPAKPPESEPPLPDLPLWRPR